jgi:hypothetical protein
MLSEVKKDLGKGAEPIAIIFSDFPAKDGKRIWLDRHPSADAGAPSTLCGRDPLEMIGEDFIKSGRSGRKVKKSDMALINAALSEQFDGGEEKHIPDSLAPLYSKACVEVRRQLGRREIKEMDGLVFPLPIIRPGFREVFFVVGPSGAGKSSWAVRYIILWLKANPGRNVYRFSRVENDKTFDRIKGMYKNVILDERMITEPITPEMLANSLVVFDDIDTIRDEAIKEAVHKLRDDLMETGRHENVYIINTSHKARDWNATKTSSNEATAVTIFPKSGTGGAIRDFLRIKCGYDAAKIKKLMDVPSPWATVYLTYPNYVVHEHGVFID